MTPETLAELRRLAEAASNDNWYVRDARLGDRTISDGPCVYTSATIKAGHEIVAELLTAPNAAFIVAARNALPALLDELDGLRAVLKATIRRE